MRGKLLARGGIDIPNREILLLARTAGNPFAVVAMSRTDSDGVARFPVSPTVKTAYRLKFDGTRLLRPSRSGVVRVGVRPVVTASAAPTTIDPGESTTVSGLVTYEDAPYVGATVDLLARNPHRHGRFSVIATSTTGALGEVTFVQSPTRTTVYRLLVRHAEGTPPRAVSDNVRVVVRTAPARCRSAVAPPRTGTPSAVSSAVGAGRSRAGWCRSSCSAWTASRGRRSTRRPPGSAARCSSWSPSRREPATASRSPAVTGSRRVSAGLWSTDNRRPPYTRKELALHDARDQAAHGPETARSRVRGRLSASPPVPTTGTSPDGEADRNEDAAPARA